MVKGFLGYWNINNRKRSLLLCEFYLFKCIINNSTDFRISNVDNYQHLKYQNLCLAWCYFFQSETNALVNASSLENLSMTFFWPVFFDLTMIRSCFVQKDIFFVLITHLSPCSLLSLGIFKSPVKLCQCCGSSKDEFSHWHGKLSLLFNKFVNNADLIGSWNVDETTGLISLVICCKFWFKITLIFAFLKDLLWPPS